MRHDEGAVDPNASSIVDCAKMKDQTLAGRWILADHGALGLLRRHQLHGHLEACRAQGRDRRLTLEPDHRGDGEELVLGRLGADLEDGLGTRQVLEDVVLEGDQWSISAPKELLDVISNALSAANITVTSASLGKVPKTKKIVSGSDCDVLMGLLESLEDHDDVQKVYHTLA